MKSMVGQQKYAPLDTVNARDYVAPGFEKEGLDGPFLSIRTGAASSSPNPNLLRRNHFHAVLSRLSDPACVNPQAGYQNYPRLIT